MTALELLIRPFERRDVSPPKRIIEQEKPVEPVAVSFGEGGNTVFPYRLFTVIEFQTIDSQTYKELGRESHTKRIENPNDKNQFVEVEVIDRLYLRNKVDDQNRPIYELNNK